MILKRLPAILICMIVMSFTSVSCAEVAGVSQFNIAISKKIAKYNLKTFDIQYHYTDLWQVLHSHTENTVQQKCDFLSLSYSQFNNTKDVNESTNILGMYILAGIGKLRYNVEGTPLYKFDYEYIKGGGINYEIPLLSLNERFSVYNELGFSVFNAKTSVHTIDTVGGADPATNYYDINLTFSPNTVTLVNTVKYTLTPNAFKYYVSLGIYNSFVVSSTNTRETYHYTNGEPLITKDLAVPDPTVYGLMLLISTGFSYKNIGFELRFDPGRNYSSKLNYAVYMPSFNALLHVRFNSK
jgi:hypothetical protein